MNIKQHVLDRIKSPVEWPDNGQARMALIQIAYDQGWFMEVLN